MENKLTPVPVPYGNRRKLKEKEFKKWVYVNRSDIDKLYNIYQSYLPKTLTINEFANYLYVCQKR